MNSEEALHAVEAMVAGRKITRVSSPERTSKAVIFRTGSGRNFAVEINDVNSRHVKLVFERTPGGAVLEWDAGIAQCHGRRNDQQFESSALKTRGANLEPGKQISVLLTTAQDLEGLIDWYAAVSPAEDGIANRIRACALSNYITPARERGDASVTIRAGTLHDELGLSANWATVCHALRGKKFQDLAKLSAPKWTGPEFSTTTTFTYSLATQAIPMPQIPAPTTNLILYGPPGTGKTYATAAEAVRLCLGEAEAAPLLAEGQRAALMAAYRELLDAGRIDFVTFHQSYSYEDFVEGLRPTTDNGAEDGIGGAASGGFRLRSEDGIFKLICERARIDRGDVPDDERLDRDRRIFKMSLGRRGAEESRIEEGLANNLVHLGWGGDIDWSDERFDSFDQIQREWNSKKDASATGTDGNIQMIYSLRADMRIGDYVVISDGRDAIRAVGEVTGDYYYDAAAPYHPHRRKVEWLWKDAKGAPRDIFYNRYFRQHSIYRLNPETIAWDALDHLVFDKAALQDDAVSRPYVLVIDEINRANISKVFGELITLLEPDKRLGADNEIKVKLPYSDGPAFGVPANLHIIGTMNTADRSIALLDTALRRRFTFRELMPQPDLLKVVDGIDLAQLLENINDRIEYLFDREHQIGHAYFIGCTSRQQIDEVMRHKVIPLLAEYFYEDWNKVAAVLGDANEGEGDHAGGFLERKKLACPRGMGGDGDAPVRFRWSVRAQFDYAHLVR